MKNHKKYKNINNKWRKLKSPPTTQLKETLRKKIMEENEKKNKKICSFIKCIMIILLSSFLISGIFYTLLKIEQEMNIKKTLRKEEIIIKQQEIIDIIKDMENE